MKNYYNLVKTMLIMQFRTQNTGASRKKKNIARACLLAGYTLLMGLLVWSFVAYAKLATTYGVVTELLTLVQLGCIAFLVVTGLVFFLSTMYYNRDIQFLITYPVSATTVYMAKFTIVYLTQIVVATFIILIPMLAIGITAGLGIGFYFVAILSLLIVPAIPILIVGIFSVPILHISLFFKNRGISGTLIVLLIIIAAFAGYIALVSSQILSSSSGEAVEDTTAIAIMIQEFANVVRTIGYVFLPIHALSCLATGIGIFGLVGATAVVIQIVIAIGIPLVLVAISAGFSRLFYRRIVLKLQENHKRAVKVGLYTNKTPLKSIMIADFKNILRTPFLAIGAFVSIIMPTLMVVLFGVVIKSSMESTADMTVEEIAEMSAMLPSILSCILYSFILIMSACTNGTAQMAFTRESSALSVLKTMPININQMVKSKLVISMSVASVGMIAGVIASAFFQRIEVLFVLPFIIFNVLLMYFVACYFIRHDLKSPMKLTVPGQRFKQYRNSLIQIPMVLAVMFLAFAAIGFNLFLPIFSSVNEVLVKCLLWVLFIGIAVGLAVWQHKVLFNRAQQYWNSLE